jgi:hypothetical protein
VILIIKYDVENYNSLVPLKLLNNEYLVNHTDSLGAACHLDVKRIAVLFAIWKNLLSPKCGEDK